MKITEHIEKQLERFKEPYGIFQDDDDNKVNRYEDIKRIHFYLRDKFMECDDENAIFWNIAKPNAPHFKKNILPSIKDFYPEGRGEYNYFQSWILKIRFRKWARESGFVFDLDDLADQLTNFGECIWKVTGKDEEKDINVVDLRNIYFDRSTKFEHTDKIEVHYLTESQIRAKEGVWDNVEQIIEEGEKSEDSGMAKYKIVEFEGWYKEDKLEKIHSFTSGSGDNEIVAFKETLKANKTRYYRFEVNEEMEGVFQRLFVLQELANRRVNQNDEAQAIASLLLLRSTNNVGNALTDARSGDIVNDPTLEQVPIDNRAISAFAQEMMMIEQQAQAVCMTPEVMRGEDLPSGTPFRSMATLSNKAAKAFKSLRTRIAEQVIQILIDDIFPEIVKGWEDDYLEIVDSEGDIREYDSRVIPHKLVAWMKEQYAEKGRYPTVEEQETKKQELVEDLDKRGRQMYIPKGFFNWKYGFIYNPSNEVEDRAQQNDVMNNLIQYKMANPMIANDPMFRQLAEKNGVSAFKMSKEEMQEMAMAPQGQAPQPKTQDKLMSQVDTN